MRLYFLFLFLLIACSILLLVSCKKVAHSSSTVPFILDHNRMVVEAEIQRKDGSWRIVKLWIDSGNPEFFLSEEAARDLGIDFPELEENMEIEPPQAIRLSGMQLNFAGVKSQIMIEPYWLFSATHIDGNLPSTVLQKYHVIFDYPLRQLTIAEPGTIQPRGIRADASINPGTGIAQIDAVIDGDSMSFALDNGASYSFTNSGVIEKLAENHPDWQKITGTTGCANMWGWWPPRENLFPVWRLPEILW